MVREGTRGGAWVILTAAGLGTRLGADQPKALVSVSGMSLVRLALDRVAGIPGLRGVVITVPAGFEQDFATEAKKSVLPESLWRITEGGDSRQASVWTGLKQLETWVSEVEEPEGRGARPDQLGTQKPTANGTVLVHDAARALAPTSLMYRLIKTLSDNPDAGGVIPGLPVSDTIKQVRTTGGGVAVVTSTPDRADLRAIQTPQAFRLGALHAAHEAHGGKRHDETTAATDDAVLLEWEGHQVLVVEGDPLAFKVTTAADLQALEDQLALDSQLAVENKLEVDNE